MAHLNRVVRVLLIMRNLLEQMVNSGCLRGQLLGKCEQLPDKHFTVGGFA